MDQNGTRRVANAKKLFSIGGEMIKRATDLTDDEFFKWYTSIWGVPKTTEEIRKYTELREKCANPLASPTKKKG